MAGEAPRRATLGDVAAGTGVSKSTVSYILRKVEPHYSRYAAETIERVERVAAEIGYVPSLLARSLSHQHLPYFGVFFERVRSGDLGPTGGQSSLMWDVYEGIADAARQDKRYPVMLTNPGSDAGLSDTRDELDHVVRSGLSGVIGAVHPRTWNDYLVRWEKAGIPCISLFDAGDKKQPRWYVDLDNRAVGRMAWAYLSERGHKKMMCLCQEGPNRAVFDRVEAFTLAQKESGNAPEVTKLTWSQDGVCRVDESGRSQILDNLKKTKTTAVFCADAGACLILDETFSLAGIRVPGDYSLIGIDIPIWTPASRVITQIACPGRTIGEEATRLLTARLSGAVKKQTRTLVHPVLHERSSVATV